MRLVTLLLPVFLLLGACKEDPGEQHRLKANELYKKSDFAAAGAEFEASLQANPKQDQKVYEKAAFSFMKAGNHDRAAQLLLKTLDFQKDTEGKLSVYRNIAGMYQQDAHEPENAEKYYLEMLKLAPGDEGTVAWLAELASERGGARAGAMTAVPEHLDRALGYYDQLIAMSAAPAPHLVNKRIVLIKYLDYLAKMKAQALKDADDNQDNKESADDFRAQAQKYQEKADLLKTTLDETTRKFGEASKAAKAAAKP